MLLKSSSVSLVNVDFKPDYNTSMATACVFTPKCANLCKVTTYVSDGY